MEGIESFQHNCASADFFGDSVNQRDRLSYVVIPFLTTLRSKIKILGRKPRFLFYTLPGVVPPQVRRHLSALLIFIIQYIKLTAARLCVYLECSRDVQQHVLGPRQNIEAASKPCKWPSSTRQGRSRTGEFLLIQQSNPPTAPPCLLTGPYILFLVGQYLKCRMIGPLVKSVLAQPRNRPHAIREWEVIRDWTRTNLRIFRGCWWHPI
jgi:hypothetical protein